MTDVRWPRRWWQVRTRGKASPLEGDSPAWVASLVIHVVVLLLMALAGLPGLVSARRVIAIVSPPEVEDLAVEPEMIVDPTKESGFGGSAGSDVDVTDAVAPVLAENPLVRVVIDEADDPVLEVMEPDAIPSAADLTEALNAGAVGEGDAGVGTAHASGAVDRLTAEIVTSLQQRPTLVCWIFDQSVSLAGQRKEIADRLRRVFGELQTAEVMPAGRVLENLVFGYGHQVQRVLDKPSADTDRVVEAIASIPVDDTGVEMTFSAIAEAAKTAQRFRASAKQCNVMIVVFTDEVGDDQQKADAVTRFCREHSMRTYVVGVPAPFGQGEVAIKFREFDLRFDDGVQWARVRQGPETLFPEVVRIRSGTEADEPLDSGFGPFSLSKLCAETGGMYFCVHANRETRGRVGDRDVADMSSRLRYFFDPEVMRPYRPDYLPTSRIERILAGNRAMRALVEAATASEIAPMESPVYEFPRQDDGTFVNLLSNAQKKAAVLQPRIDALLATLASGLPDRDRLTEKRWQAGFDLAMGRVLALKVRTDSYNIILAQAKSGMTFVNPQNDTWRLVSDREIAKVGSQTEKLANQARTYLSRVVDDHPGTPWAYLAAAELRIPLGYRWEEAFTGVNAPVRPAAGGGGGRPRDDMPRRLAPPKPKRPLKNI